VKPWRLLSVLLQYPDAELVAALDELGAAGSPAAFLAYLRSTPLRGLQASYVQTFDFDRRASLYLTYHTHGDRRQRGLELVRLKRRYAEAGLLVTDGELPDYLPLVLEFAALAPGEGEALLNELRVPLELVRARLHANESPYAELLDALVGALPRRTKAQVDAARRLAEAGPPAELVGLEPFAAEAPA
jgi:nitrate reductase delta subunit